MESRCAKRCLVTDDNVCSYYTINAGHCQLARYTYSSSSYKKGDFYWDTEYQLKQSVSVNLGSMMESLLESSDRHCPGIGFHTLTYNGQKVCLMLFRYTIQIHSYLETCLQVLVNVYISK